MSHFQIRKPNSTLRVRSVSQKAALTIVLLGALGSTSTAADAPKFAPGEVIVQFKPNAKSSAPQEAARGIGATSKAPVALPRTFVYELHGRSVESAVEGLSGNPNVAIASPNYLFQITTTTPCDPYTSACDPEFWRQYALQNTGQNY